MRAALLTLALPLLAQDPFATEARIQAATAAGPTEEALRLLKEGLGADPANTRLLLRAQVLSNRLGHPEEARAFASKILALGVDPSAAGLDESLRVRAEALHCAEGRAEVAAVLPGAGLLVEGIAADPRGGVFLAAVNRRSILHRDRAGHVKVWASLEGWAPLALAVDARRGLLWVAGGTVEEMEGFEPKGARVAALAAFDLRTHRRVREARLDATEAKSRAFGDLLLHPDGTIYASDGSGGGLWRLRPGAAVFEPFIPEGRLRSPQGMAWMGDGALLLADYALGLFRVESDGSLHPLAAPEGVCLLGLDGLVAWKGAFYATQNGVTPARLWRLDVNGGRVRARSLLRAHPAFGEPTLLAATPRELLVVANAQWDRFGMGGIPKAETERVVLLRVR